MIDIDALEKLVKTVISGSAAQKSADPVIRNMGRLEFDDACKQYMRATNPAAILELIAEVRRVRKAAAFYDDLMASVQGCTDGGCLIRAPKGMHTNGGCRCNRDSMKTQRVLYVAKQLRDAIGGAK
jgi:hypothetical protein